MEYIEHLRSVYIRISWNISSISSQYIQISWNILSNSARISWNIWAQYFRIWLSFCTKVMSFYDEGSFSASPSDGGWVVVNYPTRWSLLLLFGFLILFHIPENRVVLIVLKVQQCARGRQDWLMLMLIPPGLSSFSASAKINTASQSIFANPMHYNP